MACEEDDKMDMDKVVVPNGYALSAGTSTIFLNSSVAYDTEADWVSGTNASRFNNGDGLYDDVRIHYKMYIYQNQVSEPDLTYSRRSKP